jgi:hypothetical protein
LARDSASATREFQPISHIVRREDMSTTYPFILARAFIESAVARYVDRCLVSTDLRLSHAAETT